MDLNTKLQFSGFFETNESEEAKHQINVQVLLQSPNPVINTKILTPELVGDQSKMVVKQFFHTCFKTRRGRPMLITDPPLISYYIVKKKKRKEKN